MSLGDQRAYQVGAVATASPSGLVTMLFDAAITAIGRARPALIDSSPASVELAHRELTRAQDIVLELQLSLDHDGGGEISSALAALYDFCLDRLIRANVSKDPALLDAVSQVLSDLRSGWVEAADAALQPQGIVMGWDELLVDWEQALDDIESALAAGSWQELEDISWPVPENVAAAPNSEQRLRAAALSERQVDAAARIATMLEEVGREIRDAAAARDAVHAYEAAGRREQSA